MAYCTGMLLACVIAAGSGEAPMDLPALWRLADQHNPELSALAHDVEAAGGRAWQARLYPNPTLGVDIEDTPAEHFGLSRSQNMVVFSQPLEWTGKRAARVTAASAEITVAQLALAEKRQEVFAEIADEYVELSRVATTRALFAAFERELEEPLSISRQRVAMRAAPRWEEDRTRLALLQLRLEASALAGEEQAARARLARLLGVDDVPFQAAGVTATWPGLDEGRLVAVALSRHPGIARAQSEIAAAQRRVMLARTQARPDLEMRVALGRNTAENDTIIEGGVAVSLPLWNRNQGAIAQANALLQKAEKERDAAVARVREAVAVALAEYHSARAQLASSRRDVIALAQQVEEFTRAGYRTGKQEYLEWLEARKTVIDARRTELGLSVQAQRAAARLWVLADAPLENFTHEGE